MDNNEKKRKRELGNISASQTEDAAKEPKKLKVARSDSSELATASESENKGVPPPFASLERPEEQGMNPRNILMGIYGPRGEKIKHTVHDGALKLPGSAIEILNDIQQEASQQTGKAPTKSFKLPAIDSVLRPTMDTNLDVIVITELTATERKPQPQSQVNPVDGMQQPQQPPAPSAADQSKWQTHARNWKLRLQQPKEADAAQRIRGGGDSDVIMNDANSSDVPNEHSSPPDQTMTDASAVNEPGEEQPDNQPAGAPSETSQGGAQISAEPVQAAFLPPKTSGEVSHRDKVALPTGVASAEATATQPSVEAPTDSRVIPSVGVTDRPPPVSGTIPTAAMSQSAAETAATAGTATTTALDESANTASTTVQSAASPAPVTSSTATTATKARVPAVIPLPTKPPPQWEQQMPGPNDEMQAEPKTPKPSWYSADTVSDLERRMLPEWFDGTAMHRTPETYRQTRERIIEISDKLKQRYVTGTLVRRTVPGDAGSLLRLHEFLTTWGFINEQAINDSAPTPSGYHAETGASGERKTDVVWSAKARDELMEAVVDESKKRRKVDGDTSFVPIDWDVVSKRVGNGASATDCEKVFLALPLEAAMKTQEERSITPEVTSSEQRFESIEERLDFGAKILKDIVEEAPPEVVKAATDAALAATANLEEARKAGMLAVVASEATSRAQKEEATVGRLLIELQEQRLQKLENRLALLDDIEDILEAERVALELERRDLYTARCRHWFGGAS